MTSKNIINKRVMINNLMVSVLGVRTGQKSVKGLFGQLASLSKRHSLLLQAFDPDSVVSERQLAVACELSQKAINTKTNLARTPEAELLLRAAGTEKIDRAIERVGVKDSSRFILFSPSLIPGSVLRELGEEDKSLLKLTGEKRKKIAKLFSISERELSIYSLEDLVLERMALMEG